MVQAVFAAEEVTLDLNVNVFARESVDEQLRVVCNTEKSNNALRKFRQLLPPHCARAFRAAEMRLGEQLAEILVTPPIFHEQRQDTSILHC